MCVVRGGATQAAVGTLAISIVLLNNNESGLETGSIRRRDPI